MSDTVSSGTTPPGFPADDNLAQQAVDLAQKWVHSSADFPADAAAQRLAGVLRDPNGLPFTIGFVDGVMRPESVTAAATRLHHVAPLVPEFLPWYLRGAVRVGGAVAPMLPTPVVPIARTALREMVGHLVVDARPHKLGPAIARIRESGARLNLNLLGEAVLGEDEARRRLAGIHELIRRDDVDYVSVKVSAIVSRISMWAFDEVVADVVERLLPLYLSAAEDGTFINLDMEEYRDLDLTIAVFTRLLEDERLRGLEAGIVLQAYLPDAADALDELTAWAQARVAAGGSRIKVRLVKGANLAMERVDATIHGWPLATHASKLDADAMYLRCLDRALRPERSAAVRLGVAGHNLFDIAYAWLLAGERGVSDDIEIEMLLGMAQGQVAAVTADVGHVLLYVPVVRPDEFDVAISYLVRRLEENASSENFLSAAFDLATDASLFERERDRFLASLERAADPALPSSPNRTQDRTLSLRPIAPQRITRDPAGGDDGLTQAVLGIADAAGRSDDTTALGQHDDILFGGERFVETAVYAPRETRRAPALGAPGFANTPDSDPALAVNREWARGILSRIAGSTAGDETIAAARVDDAGTLDEIVARVGSAASAWGAMAAADRSAVLLAASRALESRRAELIEVAASETGKVLAEADVEVSEAVDFAAYYAATARELDRVSGAVFQPASVTVVTRRGTSRSPSPPAACSRPSLPARASSSSPRRRPGAARRSSPRRCGTPVCPATCSRWSTSTRAISADASSPTRRSTASSSPARGRRRRCSGRGGPSCRCWPRRAARTRSSSCPRQTSIWRHPTSSRARSGTPVRSAPPRRSRSSSGRSAGRSGSRASSSTPPVRCGWVRRPIRAARSDP